MEVQHYGEIYLDNIMSSAAHARTKHKISAEHLIKVWKINLKKANRTIYITSKNCGRVENPKLSRNYGKNDRMILYKMIKDFFFVDTLFDT